MITRQNLDDMETSLLALGSAANTLDEALARPLFQIREALAKALYDARLEFIGVPRKTPQIEELSQEAHDDRANIQRAESHPSDMGYVPQEVENARTSLVGMGGTQAAQDPQQEAAVSTSTQQALVCPLCEDHPATESMSDHLFSATEKEELPIERDQRICKGCHEELSERYPEETKEARISRDCANGYAHLYYPDTKEDTFDVLYEGPIEADSQTQQVRDIRPEWY